MKLVDILAHEFKSWPDDCDAIEQDRRGTCLYKVNGPAIATYVGSLADDADTAKVTRAQWQAAVDALKAEVHPTESMALHHQEVGRITRQWSGEGLPPVGIDVEVFAGYSHPRFDRFIGQRVHIIAHDVINGDPVAVFRMPIDGDDAEQDYHAMVASSFRPIRTPEQIAAEERAAGIQALKAIFDSCSDELMPTSNKYLDTLFGAIHDAGYRKFEIVDN